MFGIHVWYFIWLFEFSDRYYSKHTSVACSYKTGSRVYSLFVFGILCSAVWWIKMGWAKTGSVFSRTIDVTQFRGITLTRSLFIKTKFYRTYMVLNYGIQVVFCGKYKKTVLRIHPDCWVSKWSNIETENAMNIFTLCYAWAYISEHIISSIFTPFNC